MQLFFEMKSNGRFIDTILSRIRDEKGSSDSGVFDDKDRRTSGDDVRLDRQTLQGESVGRRHYRDSRENQEARKVIQELKPLKGKVLAL